MSFETFGLAVVAGVFAGLWLYERHWHREWRSTAERAIEEMRRMVLRQAREGR